MQETLGERLVACALAYSGVYDVARSIGNNVACYPADAYGEELHDAVRDCLKRHLEMGCAVSDIEMCTRSLCRVFTRWHAAQGVEVAA